MTILIPLAERSLNNFFELKYALRSQCLHNDITDCILVGGKPNWYTGHHINHIDYNIQRKEENIRDKVFKGSENIKDEFLYSNDDFFTLAPYPGAHNKGTISKLMAGRNPNGSYTRLLQNTLNRFGDVPFTDTHCSLMMNPYGVKRLQTETWVTFGYGIKTTYCELNRVESTYYPDRKVSSIQEVNPAWPYFSTWDTCRHLKLLEKMYPNKSYFER